MLGNRSFRTGYARIQCSSKLRRIVGVALLLGTLLPAGAQAQKSNGPAKPLPARSHPTTFYTPQGQQQMADAILTDALDQLGAQADEHYEHGEYNHTVNINRILVQGNPRNVEAYADAAHLLWSTGQNDAATAFLKQGLAANPDSYYMYDELGVHFLLRLKDYPNAVSYYEQAVKYPCPFFTWSNLAHSYEKLNQWEKAVTTWEKAANYVTRGGESGTGKHDSAPAAADSSIGDTMKHNLARARAELAKRQKQ